MSRKYSISGTDTNTASTTGLAFAGTTAVRPMLYDVIISPQGVAPADNACEYQIKRHTAIGTSTAVTPQALDSGDPAAATTAGVNHSVEPTYTANAILLDVGVNMRATFRWVAVPGGELKCPASTNGLGLFFAAVNSAFGVAMTLHFEE